MIRICHIKRGNISHVTDWSQVSSSFRILKECSYHPCPLITGLTRSSLHVWFLDTDHFNAILYLLCHSVIMLLALKGMAAFALPSLDVCKPDVRC